MPAQEVAPPIDNEPATSGEMRIVTMPVEEQPVEELVTVTVYVVVEVTPFAIGFAIVVELKKVAGLHT